MALSGVARTHDFLQFDAFDMGALTGDDSVCLADDRSLAEHGNDPRLQSIALDEIPILIGQRRRAVGRTLDRRECIQQE